MGVSSSPAEAEALPGIRAAILAGIFIYLLTLTADLVRFPGVWTDAGSAWPGYLALIVVTVGLYGALVRHDTWPAAPATARTVRTGVRWGLVIGGLWMIEVVVGNAPLVPASVAQSLYVGATTSAYLLPAVVGGVVARRSGSVEAGVRASAWCGLSSGLITALWLLLFTHLLLALGVSQHDPQNIREYHLSHAPDLVSFIVGDTLLGATNHLWLIGPVMCTMVGVVGGAIGQGSRC